MTPNEQKTFAGQLADSLRSAIRSGQFPPGSKLPGERKLSAYYGICRATVVAALEKLEKENLIKKIPARGNFVQDAAVTPRILLVWPGEEWGKADTPENTFAFFAFYRGMLHEAAKNSTEISTICVPQKISGKALERYVTQIDAFDSIVFPQSQLGELLPRHFLGRKTLIERASFFSPPVSPERKYVSMLTPDYMLAFNQLAGRMLRSGRTELTILTPCGSEWFTERAKMLAKAMKTAGVSARQIGCPPGKFEKAIPSLRGKTIFFNHTRSLGLFYHFCMLAGLLPGRDMTLITMCSGETLSTLIPPPPYIKIPNYEIGRRAFQIAWKRSAPQIIAVPPDFVEVPNAVTAI